MPDRNVPPVAPGLDALLAPRSVAIVGASADPARIGGRPLAYYLAAGFEGPIYPVNPTRTEVQGLPAYASLCDVAAEIDFALLAIPAEAVPDTLDACAATGVKAAVIFSASFAERDAGGAARQREIIARARAAGIRILGPNCLGLYNAAIGHCPTFSSFLQDGPPPPGRVGLITQSGAYGTHLLNMARARRIGVRLWASTGNEADVSLAEILDHMIADPGIDAIGCYMETVHDRVRFLGALERARAAGKLVTVMKVGTSQVGARAAQSHTASLAGSDASIDAALARSGIPRARTTEEMLDLVYAAAIGPPPKGDRLGIVTISGGAGVLMADAAERHALAVPALPEAAQAALLAANPLCAPRNPVDVTAHAMNDPDLIGSALRVMAESGTFDMTAAFFTSWTASPRLGPLIRATLNDTRDPACPIALVCQGDAETLAGFERDGFLVFEDPSRAVRALAHLAAFAQAARTPPAADPAPLIDPPVTLPGTKIGEAAAKALLREAGIDAPREIAVATPGQAAAAAAELGFPVALKILSPDIAHKTELGGVALDLQDGTSVERAADAMRARVAETVPGVRIDGFLVARMAGAGVELILGARVDPVMGPIVLVGLGGIFVEVMQDVVVELAPIGPARARAMLDRLRGRALLAGVRGRPAVDLDAAAMAIARLSVVAADNADRFSSIEINPLLIQETGAVALDALVLPPETDCPA